MGTSTGGEVSGVDGAFLLVFGLVSEGSLLLLSFLFALFFGSGLVGPTEIIPASIFTSWSTYFLYASLNFSGSA